MTETILKPFLTMSTEKNKEKQKGILPSEDEKLLSKESEVEKNEKNENQDLREASPENNAAILDIRETKEAPDKFYYDRFKEGRLGYLTIDFSVIEEVANLERMVAEIFGISIDEVQKRFLSIKNYRKDFHYSIMPFAIIMKDYRSFLIGSKEVFRIKKQRFISV